ncbi:aminotransferase class V-fold PLP-dependent enzyme [Selenomonas ruminis]|uniref:Aminotransferase class V-fold PLP-dependent enzyme n=1 Tax=Selenomonas ruminis TaxID=2593411 RepID=A0A5D6WCV0_9FIRM|nr:aminotransferase class V-fold PLP-dependent enzyme [Selenomonas sp. mPRGC5]TYZ24658.1 aminotransferase class V-fold PLP-dependent enzyme [Selenomonas sp. mPRGC5]
MVYFNNAATTYPKPAAVYEAMDEYYRNNAGSLGRGGKEMKSAGTLVADTRQLLKELLHTSLHEVIFTPTATLALNMIIQGLMKRPVKNVYITPFEHNAVTRVLHAYADKINLRILAVNKDCSFDLERIGYQFADCQPDLVIMSHASNVIGVITPVAEVFALAKKYEAITVVDMAQTAGLVDFDIAKAKCDFAVFAGHKTLYGPTGISGFLMNPDVELPTILYGGTGIDSANQDMPKDIPARYEMGTPNMVAIAGLHAALMKLKENNISSYYWQEQDNRKHLLDVLNNYDFVRLVGINNNLDYVGVVSFIIDGISSDSAGQLFSRLGVELRTGLHCAPLAHEFLGTYPAGTIRTSVGIYTNEEDLLRLNDSLYYIKSNL